MSKNKLFKKMCHKAIIKEHGDVHPCGSHKSLEETFIIDDSIHCAVLAYDKSNHSSGAIICPLTEEAYEIYGCVCKRKKA